MQPHGICNKLEELIKVTVFDVQSIVPENNSNLGASRHKRQLHIATKEPCAIL